MKKVIKIGAWTAGAFAVACLALMLICFAICKNGSDNPAEILKERIESAKMKEYVDSVYRAKLLYPDFFEVDTTDEYSKVRFCYSDDKVKELSLSLDYFPPRLFKQWGQVNVLSNRRKNAVTVATSIILASKMQIF